MPIRRGTFYISLQKVSRCFPLHRQRWSKYKHMHESFLHSSLLLSSRPSFYWRLSCQRGRKEWSLVSLVSIQLQISLSQQNQLDDSPTPASTTLPTCSFQDSHACEAILDQHGCHGNHGQTPVVQLRGELQLTLSRVLAGWIGIPSIESCLFNGDPMGSSFYALGFSRILT